LPIPLPSYFEKECCSIDYDSGNQGDLSGLVDGKDYQMHAVHHISSLNRRIQSNKSARPAGADVRTNDFTNSTMGLTIEHNRGSGGRGAENEGIQWSGSLGTGRKKTDLSSWGGNCAREHPEYDSKVD